jgi:8-oxo-dGTP pyrophosphatase MutT (NUDIX family)
MTFAERLQHTITNQLPGEKAHLPLSPLHRPVTSEVIQNLKEYKESAVSVVIYETDNQFKCILIQRTEYEGKHSGQISFPGGKKDKEDPDLKQTAIRECFEEVGVAIHESHLIGKLSSVYIPVSGFLVEPYIFFYPEQPSFQTQIREVASVFTIALNDLLDESIIGEMKINTENQLVKMKVPCFNIENKQIWGATALILNELREVLKIVNYK